MTIFNEPKQKRQDDIVSEVKRLYAERMEQIRMLANGGEVDACLRKAEDLMGFMNRFRNCNLGFYFDEELHAILAGLNPARYDASALLRDKSVYRMAFVFNRFNDTGGAAFSHRYMLENLEKTGMGIKQYVLITNDANSDGYEHHERYQYMRDHVEVEEFHFIQPQESIRAKAEQVQQWLFDRQIDFAVIQPSPLTLYALASNPVLISGTFSADCHVYTIGPGTGDFTFYVQNDQVFKYRYQDPNFDERRTRNILLPLPPEEYTDTAEPVSRSELGVPEDAVLSATTNLWKCNFGDGEILFEGIAELLRRHPQLHHIFLGTPRCLDGLEFFLNRNPELKSRVSFVGAYPHIYKVFKQVDFFINSFPVSGASNTEMAALGKPSIDLFSHQDLSFHGTEFLRSNECLVSSMAEFLKLGERLILDEPYRNELGDWLKSRVRRDLNKAWLSRDRLYETFLDEFQRRLKQEPEHLPLGVDQTIECEKRLAFFSAHVRYEWSDSERWDFLAECRQEYPGRSFGWVLGLEEVIRQGGVNLELIQKDLPPQLLLDTRVRVMLALACEVAGEMDDAMEHAQVASEIAIFDQYASKVLSRLNQIHAGENLPPMELPIYYNY